MKHALGVSIIIVQKADLGVLKKSLIPKCFYIKFCFWENICDCHMFIKLSAISWPRSRITNYHAFTRLL